MNDVEVEPGIRLRLRHRDGSREPFLLVHGLSSNAHLWDEVADHLAAAGHPSWSVDLRGHGESDAPEHGYDTGTAADDLAAIIAALGLSRPIVAGQSWGGNVVVRLAAKHPELPGAIGLVDGGWIDLRANFPDWTACEAALRPGDIDGRPATDMRGWLESSHPDWSATAKAATLANMRVEPDGTMWRRLTIPRHLLILRSLWDEPAGADLPLVTVPALLLPARGPDDERSEQVRAAAAAMPQARISWYPGADHDLHAQHPDRVAADLLTLVPGAEAVA
ncbi:alpha/beta fold hydrolase [Catellatospora tritici]|uniref:alpha/beta fold hydrolase n=1 Tax=Catellatospora tritici TaxID=2851566 RepID=UPI001C2DA9F0|nr:alpha/beta hydrolase [Catellatospora tritici]MBV1849673.1 alpha/beta hydrolase [Catellatospora tritici]